jgi:sulfur-oxidizing protein SoxZ
MADGVRARVKIPKLAQKGEIITVKTLINHRMESGRKKNADGNIVKRSIINRFVADFNHQNVIDVSLEPAISTNPYFEFEATVFESGLFQFTWYDDDGSIYKKNKEITVI